MKIKTIILILGLSMFSNLSGCDLPPNFELNEDEQSWLQREAYIIKKFINKNEELFGGLIWQTIGNVLFFAFKPDTFKLKKIYEKHIREQEAFKPIFQNNHARLAALLNEETITVMETNRLNQLDAGLNETIEKLKKTLATEYKWRIASYLVYSGDGASLVYVLVQYFIFRNKELEKMKIIN